MVVVEFVSGLIGLLGTALVVSPFARYGAGDSLIAGFTHGVFLAPLPFHVGAFLALAFLVPVARRSPLPVILLRAVLAGAAGTIALALVGVATGAFGAVRGSGAARLVTSIVTVPLQSGLPLTLMLVATTTAAWLWLGRRGAVRAGRWVPLGRSDSPMPSPPPPCRAPVVPSSRRTRTRRPAASSSRRTPRLPGSSSRRTRRLSASSSRRTRRRPGSSRRTPRLPQQPPANPWVPPQR